MDSIGAEVGQKMRSAIKAKLMELDCYVDDELPDYIMVMVANRRTKSQMNEDLNLFLSSKTSTFVNWLHIVLKKLREVTVTNPEVYKKVSKRKGNEEMPDDKSCLKVKKEKSSKKLKKELHSELQNQQSTDNMEFKSQSTSLTDNLPISANKLAEKRKIIINSEDQQDFDIVEDNFDIPLLSEVNESSNERELQDIERKIRNVKSRLGILVESDNEENEEGSNFALNAEKDHIKEENMSKHLSSLRQSEVMEQEQSKSIIEEPIKSSSQNLLGKDRRVLVEETGHKTTEEKKVQHKRITFENKEDSESQVGSGYLRSSWHLKEETGRKLSVLDRLGKRQGSPDAGKRRISLTKIREEEEKYLGYHSNKGRSTSRDRDRSKREKRLVNSRNKSRSRSRERSPYKSRERDSKKEGILRRLGVQSKVAVIKKPEIKLSSDEEEEKVVKKVSSLIKVKPRVIPSDVPQPNKNLLLKAVADAQRSIAQTPTVGKDVKQDALFTKKYREKQAISQDAKLSDEKESPVQKQLARISSRMKSRLQHSSDEYDSDGEYIPKPVKNVEGCVPSYIPSSAKTTNDNDDTKENGKQQFIITLDGIEKTMFAEKKVPVKTRLEGKKTPSPIIFNETKVTTEPSTRKNIPDKLPVVHPPLSLKNKERCKYWPSCRQGDKCEFVHPSQTCEAFPHCKFGDKCLFIHPKCKFASSCTKRDCPYDHFKASKSLSSSKLPLSALALQNCKYYPNCTNLQCPFYHPKPCKYGKYCKNISMCTYSHSFVSNKKNLSWRSK